MKEIKNILQIVFVLLTFIGAIWLSLRAIYLDYMYSRESFVAFINPFTHIKVLLHLLTDLDIYVVGLCGLIAHWLNTSISKENQITKEKTKIFNKHSKRNKDKGIPSWALLILAIVFIKSIIISVKYIERNNSITDYNPIQKIQRKTNKDDTELLNKLIDKCNLNHNNTEMKFCSCAWRDLKKNTSSKRFHKMTNLMLNKEKLSKEDQDFMRSCLYDLQISFGKCADELKLKGVMRYIISMEGKTSPISLCFATKLLSNFSENRLREIYFKNKKLTLKESNIIKRLKETCNYDPNSTTKEERDYILKILFSPEEIEELRYQEKFNLLNKFYNEQDPIKKEELRQRYNELNFELN